MKTFFSTLLGLLLLMGISVDSSSAQAAPRSLNVGVVNGKAINLPKPEYPTALRDAGIEGMAAVNIVIDEAGNVILAQAELLDQRTRKAEDGTVLEPAVLDAQLRLAAENAALGAKFAPTILSGTAVQVKGKIVYNFTSAAQKISENSSVSVGILNGKAVTLPKPEYPAAARAVGAEGAVNIQVVIDEEGSVISASAVSGHPLLRSASETAARSAKFAPTLLDGKAVRVTGVLTYYFAK
ncbi:MAG: energy transducer TonB [Pyrinomonadaceae bacterium]